jgi:hypothetical protein
MKNERGEEASGESLKERMLVWGHQSQVDSEWLRSKSPEFGLDPKKMVLGHLIRTIVSDDNNSFIYIHSLIFDRESIEGSQQNALIRLAWEIDLPETPEDLKERLKEVKEIVEMADWMREEDFEKSKDKWNKMRHSLEESLETKSELSESLEHYDTNYRKIPSAGKQQSV